MAADAAPKHRYRLPECAGQLPEGVGWIQSWIRGLEVPLSSALQLTLSVNAHHATDTMLSQGDADEPAWGADGCQNVRYRVAYCIWCTCMRRSGRWYGPRESYIHRIQQVFAPTSPGSCPTHSGNPARCFRGVSDCPKSVTIPCQKKGGFRLFNKIQVYILWILFWYCYFWLCYSRIRCLGVVYFEICVAVF